MKGVKDNMLQAEDIDYLSNEVAEDFLYNSMDIVSRLLAKNELEAFLELIGRKDLIAKAIENREPGVRFKKIAIIGDRPNGCSENDLREAAKMVGLDNTYCLEFYGFDEAKKMVMKDKFKNNPDYIAIMIGAIPHKCRSTGEYSSMLAMLQHEEGYPRIIELRNSIGELKLSTSSLQNGLRSLWADMIKSKDRD